MGLKHTNSNGEIALTIKVNVVELVFDENCRNSSKTESNLSFSLKNILSTQRTRTFVTFLSII